MKNFDQVKAGDQVVVRHYQSVALFVRKGGEAPSATDLGVVEVAPRGKKPAGVMVETTEITVSALPTVVHGNPDPAEVSTSWPSTSLGTTLSGVNGA